MRHADRPLQDRLVLRRAQRHRHRHRHRAASPTLLHEHGALSLLGLRRVRAVRRHRDVPGRRRDPSRTRTRSSSRPHKFIGGPGTPGVLVVRRELLDQPGAGRAGRRHGRCTSTRSSTATSTTRRTARRAAPRRSSSRSAPGWSSSSRQAVGVETIQAHEERAARAARSRPGGPSPASRSSATSTPSGSRSCPSSSRRPSGDYLHHNFVVALLNDLFGIQTRGGCSCAGPYGHRLLGIDLDRSRTSSSAQIGDGCEGIKPGWVRVNFNYFIADDGLRLRRRGRAPRRARGLAAARRLPLRPAHRAVAATAPARSSRRCGCAT